MKTLILLVAIAGLVLLLAFRSLGKKRDRENKVSYVCDTCGDRDCHCHREEQVQR